MNRARRPNEHILLPDQCRELLEVHAQISETSAPIKAPRKVIRMIAEIIGMKAALVCKEDGAWTMVAEWGSGPEIPTPITEAKSTLDRVGGSANVVLELWRHAEHDWTLLGLTRRTGTPAVLMISGDWTLSEATLLQLGQNLAMAERAHAMSSSAQVRVATHRLSRALARVTGFRNVEEVAVRNAARAVQAQLAALAVTDADDETLVIMATYGYPLQLVEHLRIPRGVGVLGSVFQSGQPLRVKDVTTFDGARTRRSRYRTNSFAAVPIMTGQTVLGVLSVTDRTDGRPFTQDDLSTLRTLAATMALALARERAHAQAESYAQAAAIDPVSGLFNRRYFHARLDEELQRAQRHSLSVGLLMIDVDDFKVINDTFGHLVGDAVIRDVSDILRRSVRVFDVCTRYGGEEFAVVMPGSGPEDVARVAERIRERIEAYRSADAELSALRTTVSIGLAVSAAETSSRDLISAADQALYHAKQSGKNQVKAAR
jgi:diguanylate cyclase (GGDEF)-like protein